MNEIDVFDERSIRSAPRSCRIVYSSETTDRQKLGFTHYSYGFACHKFMDSLRVLGYEPEPLELPAFYGARGLPETSHLDIHLIFRSTENIQPMSNCYNICCFAWEFEVLKTETRPFEHPFANQKRMLQTCQEIWVPSNYTKDVLLSSGLPNVHCIPSPIALPAESKSAKLPFFFSLWKAQSLVLRLSNTAQRASACDDIQPLLSRSCVTEAINDNLLFLTIFNPYDKRKNMQEMIYGFLTLLQEYTTAVLIVKLALSEQMTPLADLFHNVVLHYFEGEVTINCDRIIVISGYLSDEDLETLYRMSNFYLCGSVAEGQNLPLLEAMSYGVVPVSTVHTAMADYLTEDNCVPIRSRPFAAYRREMAADVVGRPYSVEFASQTDVGRALLRACTLSQAKLCQMRKDARQTIARRFSPAVVAGMIRDRITAITGGDDDRRRSGPGAI